MNYEVIWKIKGLENDKAEKYNPNHSTSTSINPDEFQLSGRILWSLAAAASHETERVFGFSVKSYTILWLRLHAFTEIADV